MKSEAESIRNKILDHYYSNIYKEYLFKSKRQAKGIAYFEKFLESLWIRGKTGVDKVLEIGAGQGEHLAFLSYEPKSEYILLDLRKISDHSYLEDISLNFKNKIKSVVGNAEQIPFDENYFDRTFSTCLLHHVSDPLAVLLEARRVTKVGGEIVFAIPTDPGFLNQLVKKLVSYRALSKLTTYKPELFYALEHRNHIGGILALIKFAFQNDEIKIKYGPFRISSWNLNLVIGVHILKSGNEPIYLLPEIESN
jgi:ubiquinone/menaquinone biosynthesis C-methylase UbiE